MSSLQACQYHQGRNNFNDSRILNRAYSWNACPIKTTPSMKQCKCLYTHLIHHQNRNTCFTPLQWENRQWRIGPTISWCELVASHCNKTKTVTIYSLFSNKQL